MMLTMSDVIGINGKVVYGVSFQVMPMLKQTLGHVQQLLQKDYGQIKIKKVLRICHLDYLILLVN